MDVIPCSLGEPLGKEEYIEPIHKRAATDNLDCPDARLTR